MMRDGTLRRAAPGSIGVMRNWRYVSLHASAAAAFMFLLQRFGWDAPLETGLLWALAFGGCAAALAYLQSRR
jgi:hypothetical protein